MRQLLSILSLMLLVSCGSRMDHFRTTDLLGTGEQDFKLKQYLNDFEYDMGTNIPQHLSVNLVDDLINYCKGQPNCGSNEDLLSDGVDAVCWSSYSRGEKIEIRKSRWKVLSEAGREQLLYHELGHCVLNREHPELEGSTSISDGRTCPFTIMNKWTFTEFQINKCYIPEQRHQYYLTELRR